MVIAHYCIIIMSWLPDRISRATTSSLVYRITSATKIIAFLHGNLQQYVKVALQRKQEVVNNIHTFCDYLSFSTIPLATEFLRILYNHLVIFYYLDRVFNDVIYTVSCELAGR